MFRSSGTFSVQTSGSDGFSTVHLLSSLRLAQSQKPANLLRLLLMFAPSLSRAPVAPVDLARSDPARSTRLILAKVLLLSSVASF